MKKLLTALLLAAIMIVILSCGVSVCADGDKWICAYCGTINSNSKFQCSKCGEFNPLKLDEVLKADATPTPKPTPTPEPWVCSNCGKRNGFVNAVCWNCKTARNTPTPKPTATPTLKPTPTPTPKLTPTPAPTATPAPGGSSEIVPISASLKPGDHISFGHYPQAESGTSKASIEWRVLEVRDGKALIISEYGLDAKPYDTEASTDATWEQSSLRTWLNGGFLDCSFSADEKAKILTTAVDNSRSQHFDWTQLPYNWAKHSTAYRDDPETRDKIFLLSYAEANRYFGLTWENTDNVDSRVEPTAHAFAQGAYKSSYETADEKDTGWWWLRSPGYGCGYAACVGTAGSLRYCSETSVHGVVRPALWLNLSTAGGMDSETAEMWTCKWCGNQNVNSREWCANCFHVKGTEPTPAPSSLSVNVGDHLTFGHYPQTAEGTDNTPIEWRVLEVRDGKALVISEYGLDAKPYNTKDRSVTWETCTLRTWLNADFLKAAFTSTERAGILTTAVDNSKSQGNPSYSPDGGNNTQDKVFLLSYAEAKKYFTNDEARRCAPTDYAVKQGANTSSSDKAHGKAAGCWWLRSPGYFRNFASNVLPDGSFSDYYVDLTDDVIRPAFWLDLNSVLQ